MPKSKTPKVPENACRALLVINDAKVRKDAFRNARSSLRRLEKLERTANAFDGRDQELFNTWRNEAFAEQEREADQLRRSVKRMQEKHDRIFALCHADDIQRWVACARIEKEEAAYGAGNLDVKRNLEATWEARARKYKEYLDEKDRKEWEEEQARRKRRQEEFWKRWHKAQENREARREEPEANPETAPQEGPAGTEDAAGTEEENTESWEDDSDSDFDPPPYACDCPSCRPREVTARDEEHLKLLYRQLVKELHPDKKGPGSTGKLEAWQQRLWEDAKLALEYRDLPGMTRAWSAAMVRLERLEHLTIGELQTCGQWFQRERDQLWEETADRRKSPVWNFSSKKRTLPLFWKLRRKLDKEQEQLRMTLLSYEWREAYWKKEAGAKSDQDL